MKARKNGNKKDENGNKTRKIKMKRNHERKKNIKNENEKKKG